MYAFYYNFLQLKYKNRIFNNIFYIYVETLLLGQYYCIVTIDVETMGQHRGFTHSVTQFSYSAHYRCYWCHTAFALDVVYFLCSITYCFRLECTGKNMTHRSRYTYMKCRCGSCVCVLLISLSCVCIYFLFVIINYSIPQCLGWYLLSVGRMRWQ